MRSALLLALAVPALLATPAEAAKTVDVPGAFRDVLPKVRMRTHVAILLPSTMKLDFRRDQRLYTGGAGRRRGYHLELSATRGCDGANVCFAASFTALRGAKLGFAPNVTLARGLRGHYRPLRCGASCTPPSVAWVLGDVRYEIEAKAVPGRRADLVAAANSAIRGGRR